MTTRPDRTEAADYYFTYIDQVPSGDICELLRSQCREVLDLLGEISEANSRLRYAADKWSIREVVNHINDTERVFAFRAFWFGRGFAGPLPGFDQTEAVATSGTDNRTWPSLIEEFQAIRTATLTLFETLPDEAWTRGGIASDKAVSVRALAYMTAGHVTHHVRILRERYLPALGAD